MCRKYCIPPDSNGHGSFYHHLVSVVYIVLFRKTSLKTRRQCLPHLPRIMSSVLSTPIVSCVGTNRPSMAVIDIKIDHWGKIHMQVHDMQIGLIFTPKILFLLFLCNDCVSLMQGRLTFGGLLSKQYPTVRPPSQMVAITMIVIG